MPKGTESLFFRKDEREEIKRQDAEVFTEDIRLMRPYITKDFKGVIAVNEMLNDETYFEVLPPDDPSAVSSYYVIMDGLKYLPMKIRFLVENNGWRCIATRCITEEAKDKYSEFINLAIFYGKTGKFLLENGDFKPYGSHANIFIVYTTDNKEYEFYYKATFNGHQLFVAGEHNFSCSFGTEPKRLGQIDFVDNRGIDYLYQCLFRQKH